MPSPRLDPEEIFNRARQIAEAADRRRYLDEACGGDSALRARIEALLGAHAAASSFLGEAPGAAGGGDTGAGVERAGEVIGRYTLVERIGEGGFGSVWLAEQREPVKREVALKIVKLGMDTKQVIARFEAERQALALMDHPNIARVLDGGATERGRPYFVMEYIKGAPLLEYCEAEGLETEARLRLFIQVCHAIQHAHQKGVIHRDIKPSNVLVATHDGAAVPKVIDFGIAKATSAELTARTLFTQHRQMLGTPVYMSPEQAELSGVDIDTRSDVYSLGVLLYELLTGTTPFDTQDLMSKGLAEMMRIIREVEPPKPSTRVMTPVEGAAPGAIRRGAGETRRLGSLLRGDLDWIVMKCLEKDRNRRYETADGLLMDIERYLRDEPVVAGPPSALYKLRKLVKRNKGAFSVAALIFIAMALGMIGTTWGLAWALDEKTRADAAAVAEELAKAEAQQRADELELVVEYQQSQLAEIETELMGARMRQNIIERRRAFLEGRGAGAEQIDGRLRELDSALTGVNFTSVATDALNENIFERAVKAIHADFADQPLIAARLLQTVADTLRELGLLDRATAPQAEALKIRRAALGDEHPDTLTSIDHSGVLLRRQGKLAEAEPYCREAMESRRRVLGDEHPGTLTSINNMGALLWSQGRLVEAEEHYRAALEARRRILGHEHPDTLISINNMAGLLVNQDKWAEAEVYAREALDTRRRVLGNEHPDTLVSIVNMAFVLQGLGTRGRHAEAEPYCREALDISRRVLGDEHPHTLSAIDRMTNVLWRQGKYSEAELYYREALMTRRRVLGSEAPDTVGAIIGMGSVLRVQGKLTEAEPYYRTALEISRRVFGAEDPLTVTSISGMGELLRAEDRYGEAEGYYREVMEIRRRVSGDEHSSTLKSISELGALLRDLGKLEAAEQLGAEAVQTARRTLRDGHRFTGEFLAQYALTLVAMERFAEAESAMLEAHAILESALGADHDQTVGTAKGLSSLYERWHAADPEAGHEGEAALWRQRAAAQARGDGGG